MIEVDISHVWGAFSLPDLLGMEREVFAAHEKLMQASADGSRGWLALPDMEEGTLEELLETARRLRQQSEVCVVVGVNGSCLASRAAIELLQGPNHNIGKGRGNPQIFYTGHSLSTRHWSELESLLEGKDFSVIVITRTGATAETAMAFRQLRQLLEQRYPREAVCHRIVAVTGGEEESLRALAAREGWAHFETPTEVAGRFSALSAGGLLCMAVAGIDIRAVLRGAAAARREYDLRSFENPVWLYAAVRNLMYRCGKAVELLACFEPGFRCFGSWWQQLFGEAEGKDGKGLFPVPVEYPGQLHTLGQLICQGRRNLFETMLRFDAPAARCPLVTPEGRFLDEVEEYAIQETVAAHEDSGVSVITMDCGRLTSEKVGELILFMELSCVLSAGILGVDPFCRPGVDAYKQRMQAWLGETSFF